MFYMAQDKDTLAGGSSVWADVFFCGKRKEEEEEATVFVQKKEESETVKLQLLLFSVGTQQTADWMSFCSNWRCKRQRQIENSG